jgi:polar amino acid transport system substrate-binding protein
MKILKAVILIFIIINTALASEYNQTTAPYQCSELTSKNTIVSGWYLWKPYQFNTANPNKPMGMSIALVDAIVAKVGVGIKYEEVSWVQQQLDIKNGIRDLLLDGTYTDARAKFAYFSVPYRFEENSVFILKNSKTNFNFKNIDEYLAQTRLQNFRLGVINGFAYGDSKINEFINDKANDDIVFKYKDDAQALEALIREEIDGFIDDKIAGYSAILNKALHHRIQEIKLGISTPIHLMFSRKTVPPGLVDNFNQVIKNFIGTNEYKNIIKYYLYPTLLTQIISSQLFYIITVIGTIAFAIAGLALAVKENSTLFGTFLFAMLPSVGGNIMRDTVINNNAIGITLNPSYIYYIFVIVLIGFSTVRLLNYYNKETGQDNWIQKFWNNLFVICDALGQATFIIIGVSIVIMLQIEPVELWAPFFAFLTSNGGGILRDLLSKEKVINLVSGSINAEIAIIWGFIFSIVLNLYIDDNSNTMNYMIVAIITGAFVTKLAAYYLNIPNLRFHKE